MQTTIEKYTNSNDYYSEKIQTTFTLAHNAASLDVLVAIRQQIDPTSHDSYGCAGTHIHEGILYSHRDNDIDHNKYLQVEGYGKICSDCVDECDSQLNNTTDIQTILLPDLATRLMTHYDDLYIQTSTSS